MVLRRPSEPAAVTGHVEFTRGEIFTPCLATVFYGCYETLMRLTHQEQMGGGRSRPQVVDLLAYRCHSPVVVHVLCSFPRRIAGVLNQSCIQANRMQIAVTHVHGDRHQLVHCFGTLDALRTKGVPEAVALTRSTPARFPMLWNIRRKCCST
jgi:hypothetical protein